MRDRIFDPFFTTKKISEGMGLGLHISSGEAEKLGGNIRFENNKDHGTTFIVTLPAKENKDSSVISFNEKEATAQIT